MFQIIKKNGEPPQVDCRTHSMACHLCFDDQHGTQTNVGLLVLYDFCRTEVISGYQSFCHDMRKFMNGFL